MTLNIGLPKGSLQAATIRLLAKAGYTVNTTSRSYQAAFDDPELSGMLIRAQEIARYVAGGALDAGITGRDWVRECAVDVQEVDELPFSKKSLSPIQWVIAVPEDSDIEDIAGLAGKVIATELVGVTTEFFREKGIDVKVEFSWGATEVKPPHLADAIVELTETGESLRANRLRVIGTVIESITVMIANKDSWADPEKRKKIENLALLLNGAIEAEHKVGLKMNVSSTDLDRILKILPALKNPTISNLTEDGWCAIESVVEERVVREILPELKAAGAQGIIEFPLNKVVP